MSSNKYKFRLKVADEIKTYVKHRKHWIEDYQTKPLYKGVEG